MISALLLLALVGDPQSLTLIGPGMTYHGNLETGSYSLMKHRIGGSTVLNPIEFGLVYKTTYFQMGGEYLKDCFGHNAGAIYFGPKYDFFRYFSIGMIGGVYARQTMDGGTIPTYTTHHIDIMPLPGATFAVTVPVTKHIGVEVNTLWNYVENHGNIGLKWSF